MYSKIIARYGEIAIKGKNRSSFEKQLADNMRRALVSVPSAKVARTGGRIVIDLVGEHLAGDITLAIEKLSSVFGIVSLSPVNEVSLDMDVIKTAAVEELRQSLPHGGTFKVESRRANKRFGLTSPEISREVGGYVLSHIDNVSVDVHDPDAIVTIEVRDHGCYVFSQTIPGPGGLPVGMSGRVCLLLSGGIDSPVAGWLALKRGVELEAIHFHSFPFTSERAKQKVLDLADILTNYGGRVTVHVVHFTEVQKAIRMHCPEELSITIMRRFMLRIAERIAKSRRALALVTGESLGQVASQTLESMRTINDVTTFPILRPLIGADKTEIIQLARKIGTYEISILPYEDCCTIFVPASPRTRPTIEEAEQAERELNIEALVSEAVEKTETFRFPRRSLADSHGFRRY